MDDRQNHNVVVAMQNDKLLRAFRIVHPSDQANYRYHNNGFDGVGTLVLCFQSGYCVQVQPGRTGSDLKLRASSGPDDGTNRVMQLDGKIVSFYFVDVTSYNPWSSVANQSIFLAQFFDATKSMLEHFVLQSESGSVRVWAEDDELYAH